MLVTDEDVLNVSRYVKHPAQSPAAEGSNLSKREAWVYSIIRYIVRRCRMNWPSIDETAYYVVPASEDQKATFEDFLNMIAHYGYEKAQGRKFDERELVVFLGKCKREFQHFYLSICGRNEHLVEFCRHNGRKYDHHYDIYPLYGVFMGKRSRDKGKRGQNEFKSLLTQRGWTFMESRAGAEEEDVLGISPDGRIYAIEVKNCICINQTAFLKQAKEQAQKRGKHVGWMLACSIYGFGKTFVVITATTCEIWQELLT